MDTKKSVSEHIEELRVRLFTLAIYFVLASVVGYLVKGYLTKLLLKPLNLDLYYTTIEGAFSFDIKIAILFGIITTIPFIIYQLYKYIEPVLDESYKPFLIRIIVGSIFLVILGILFAYYFCIPTVIGFLNSFNTSLIKPLLSANEYLSFIYRYIIAFSVLFQLPIVLSIVNRFKKIEVKSLFKSFNYVIILSFIIGAIITPTTDIINQIIIAIPIITLFLISIITIWITNHVGSLSGLKKHGKTK